MKITIRNSEHVKCCCYGADKVISCKASQEVKDGNHNYRNAGMKNLKFRLYAMKFSFEISPRMTYCDHKLTVGCHSKTLVCLA